MNGTIEGGYRTGLRGLLIATLALLVAGMSALSAFAQSTQGFDGGGQIGGDAYKYAAGPYAVTYDDTLYEYATGDDGKGYYTTYDGEEWTSWTGWDDQPADYQWKASAAVYGDSQYVFYNGKDEKYYYNAYDGSSWSGWEDAAGDDYKFAYAPYVNTYKDQLYLYGTADDGYAYYTAYDGEYSEWQDLGDNYDYDTYQYEYKDGYYLTYTGTDKYVYYKAYDGGAKEGDGYEVTPTPAY